MPRGRRETLSGARSPGCNQGVEEIKRTAEYVKIIEWSAEDRCFVGSCPGLFFGGCHGDDEKKVFAELCRIVEETIELYEKEGRRLPPPTSGKDYANKMLSIV